MPIMGPCPIGPIPIGMGGLRGPLFMPEGGRRGGSGWGLLLGFAAADTEHEHMRCKRAPRAQDQVHLFCAITCDADFA